MPADLTDPLHYFLKTEPSRQHRKAVNAVRDIQDAAAKILRALDKADPSLNIALSAATTMATDVARLCSALSALDGLHTVDELRREPT